MINNYRSNFKNMCYIYFKIFKIIYIIGWQSFKFVFHYNKNRLIRNIAECLADENILYVKLFQAICTNSCIFNEHQTNFLIKYTDSVPYEDAEIDYEFLNTLANIGTKKPEYNISLNLVPINSGTISVIFVGRMGDQDVVVKVIKKYIKEKLLDALCTVSYIISFLVWVPYLKHLNLNTIYEENYDMMIQQTDFQNELNNMKLFNTANKNIDYIIIPEVYDIFTNANPNIIVMNYIQGNTIKNISIDDCDIYAKLINKFAMKSILFDRLYHADLHAGNIFFIKNPISNVDGSDDDNVDAINEKKMSYKLGVIDFGIVGILNKEDQNLYYMFFKLLFDDKIGNNEFGEFLLINFVEPEYIINRLDDTTRAYIIDKLANIILYSFNIEKNIGVNNIYKINCLLTKYKLNVKRNFCKIEMALSICSNLNNYLCRDENYLEKVKTVTNELFDTDILMI